MRQFLKNGLPAEQAVFKFKLSKPAPTKDDKYKICKKEEKKNISVR